MASYRYKDMPEQDKSRLFNKFKKAIEERDIEFVDRELHEFLVKCSGVPRWGYAEFIRRFDRFCFGEFITYFDKHHENFFPYRDIYGIRDPLYLQMIEYVTPIASEIYKEVEMSKKNFQAGTKLHTKELCDWWWFRRKPKI